jgi:hypothetical protein
MVHRGWWFALTAATVAVYFALSEVAPFLKDLMGVVGASAGLALEYVFPCLFSLRLLGPGAGGAGGASGGGGGGARSISLSEAKVRQPYFPTVTDSGARVQCYLLATRRSLYRHHTAEFANLLHVSRLLLAAHCSSCDGCCGCHGIAFGLPCCCADALAPQTLKALLVAALAVMGAATAATASNLVANVDSA